MTSFKDHFSKQADAYRRYRPDYPSELFSFLANESPALEHAWDCGTGNGQAALALAKHFERVTASDPSESQIMAAPAHPLVEFVVARGEHAPLAENSVSLVTVAQALHWFDFEPFFKEVRRVLVPGGLFAAWGYELFRSVASVDTLVEQFYRDVTGPFWPPERRHIEARYQTIPFPFDRLPCPSFHMKKRWNQSDLLGYLSSWSAVQRYRDQSEKDPIAAFATALTDVWPDDEYLDFSWKIFLKLGRY